MNGNGTAAAQGDNSPEQPGNSFGGSASRLEDEKHAAAKSDDFFPALLATRTANCPLNNTPRDLRLQAYLDEGIDSAKTNNPASIKALAQYALSTIKSYLLQEAGNQEDIGKVGADGLQEAVTRADKACSQLLLNAVLDVFPESWSEEHRPKDSIHLKHDKPFVMVDPIDGTEEFKRALHGGYGNLFAFLEIRNGKHVPVGGMIVTPRPEGQEFSYRTDDGSTKMLSGTELWRTAGADGGLAYEVNGVSTPLPTIRTLEDIKNSGQIRFHVRGVFASKYNQEAANGTHAQARLMEPIECAFGTAERFEGLKNFDVRHYREVVEYAHNLAKLLGVTPVFVAAGGSGSGMNELLAGRVDVLVTLPGDRAKEWDIAPAEPLLEARTCGSLRGHLTQCNGQSFETRGFNSEDATLRDGFIASISVPRDVLFHPDAGLTQLLAVSKGEVTSPTEAASPLSTLKQNLRARGQEHLLAHLEGLTNPQQRDEFAKQLLEVDWDRLHPSKLYKLPAFTPETRVQSGDVRTVEDCRATPGLVDLGVAAYRNGEVGVLIVAGGSGTRLGASVPKGCVEAMALSKNSIYQHQCEKVLGLQARYGAKVHLYIMTSDGTDADTRQFFKDHGNFGLEADQVVFFKQGVAPTVTKDGNLMLKQPGMLLQNPDGHGGCYTALSKQGVLEHMKDRGVKYFMYGQIDNLLVRFDEPERVGLMVAEDADVVIKTLLLREPKEKQGRLVTVDGQTQVIEYIDVTDQMLQYRDQNGFLSFGWGSPSIYCWNRRFFDEMSSSGQSLPLHPSTKSVKYYDPATQQTAVGSGEKLESFIHDALIFSKKVVGLAIENRDSEFAAVKQPQGADSIGDSIRLCSNEYRRWLNDAGINSAHDIIVEISPAIAANSDQFQEWLGHHPAKRAALTDTVSSNLLISSSGEISLNAPQLLK